MKARKNNLIFSTFVGFAADIMKVVSGGIQKLYNQVSSEKMLNNVSPIQGEAFFLVIKILKMEISIINGFRLFITFHLNNLLIAYKDFVAF